MAIGTGDAVEKFGTRQVLANAQTGTVASGSFQAMVSDISNADDAVYGSVDADLTFAAAPDDGTVVEVYLQPRSIAGGADGTTPTNDFPHIYAGFVPLNAGGTGTRTTIDIGLPNHLASAGYGVLLKNNAGQNLTGWTVGFTPKAIGPAA